MINHDILVEIENISKRFLLGEVEVAALKNVSFNISAGGMVALMGPSGSGKSTLLNLIGALDTPTHGSVIVQGTRLESLDLNERADFRNQTVGFIFQNFNLIPVLTTLENVLLPSQLSGSRPAKETEARAIALLENVGLSGQIHQSVNRLSGGQMQRVAIARALINKPRLILADEPTANIDHGTSEKVLDVLKKLCANESATVIIATHDHSVLPYCKRIINLRDGVLVEDRLTEATLK